MADEPEDILDLDEEQIEQPDDPEAPENEEPEQPEDAGEDDVLIGFGDDEIAAEQETPTIRQMREALKDKDRRIKELQGKVPAKVLGPKPTMESLDFDEDKYDEAMAAWRALKAEVEAEQAPAHTNVVAVQEEFNGDLVEYATQKTKLARPDFDTAETVVTTKLDPAQQSVLVMASKNKAALIYALGKSPEKLDALASITNPIKLAIAVSDLERSLKVQARRKAPEPEPRMRGSTPKGGGSKAEARLAEVADKSGNASDLIKWRYEQKQRAKQKP